MSEEVKTAKNEVQILRDAFEGMKGRQPKSDQELKEWLATDEGKEATMLSSRLFRASAKLDTLKRPFCRIERQVNSWRLPMSALGHKQCKKSCLLCPRKRTCAV